MSANTIWRSAPVSVLAAFALGAATAAGCGAALAALMASRGMSPGTAWPFATASVCVGSLLGGWVLALLQKSRGLLWGGGLGLAYALALLGFQLAGGGVPDGAQLARLALVVLSGAAGGSAGARRTEKRRRRCPDAARTEPGPCDAPAPRPHPKSSSRAFSDATPSGGQVMWVYQEPVSSKTLAVPQAAPAPADAARPDPAPFVPFVKEKAGASSVSAPPAPVRRAALRRARGRRQDLARECAILAASYLFGALLSGVALALGSGDEQAFLSAYLDNWSRLFTLDEPGAVWTLFGAEYLTAAGSATLLLLLGLSAFGPVMIHLFAMLFGMGVGVVSLQLFLTSGWRHALLGLVLSGAPTAAAVAGLCLFGASALQVSGRLQRAAFGRQELPSLAGARGLLAQYLVLNVLFLPVCGVSTALACLAGQLL